MKKMFLLLAVVAMAATGCQTHDNDNSNGQSGNTRGDMTTTNSSGGTMNNAPASGNP